MRRTWGGCPAIGLSAMEDGCDDWDALEALCQKADVLFESRRQTGAGASCSGRAWPAPAADGAQPVWPGAGRSGGGPGGPSAPVSSRGGSEAEGHSLSNQQVAGSALVDSLQGRSTLDRPALRDIFTKSFRLKDGAGKGGQERPPGVPDVACEAFLSPLVYGNPSLVLSADIARNALRNPASSLAKNTSKPVVARKPIAGVGNPSCAKAGIAQLALDHDKQMSPIAESTDQDASHANPEQTYLHRLPGQLHLNEANRACPTGNAGPKAGNAAMCARLHQQESGSAAQALRHAPQAHALQGVVDSRQQRLPQEPASRPHLSTRHAPATCQQSPAWPALSENSAPTTAALRKPASPAAQSRARGLQPLQAGQPAKQATAMPSPQRSLLPVQRPAPHCLADTPDLDDDFVDDDVVPRHGLANGKIPSQKQQVRICACLRHLTGQKAAASWSMPTWAIKDSNL